MTQNSSQELAYLLKLSKSAENFLSSGSAILGTPRPPDKHRVRRSKRTVASLRDQLF